MERSGGPERCGSNVRDEEGKDEGDVEVVMAEEREAEVQRDMDEICEDEADMEVMMGEEREAEGDVDVAMGEERKVEGHQKVDRLEVFRSVPKVEKGLQKSGEELSLKEHRSRLPPKKTHTEIIRSEAETFYC